ncbi:RDD family protein [Halonotius sp. F2-221B]|uniref:RDD family protein n=1 Tax=Halonotius sp. F2-221B TaxID=2731620 RepID=UPI00398A617F
MTLQRIVAYLVDSILIGVVGIPFALVASVLGNTAGILLTLAGLAVILVYVFLLEGLIGYTPGKYLLGLVVVKSDGSRCTVGAALIRNLAWVIDMLPGVNLVALASIYLTDNHQRVGDLLADTLVVKQR